MEEQIKKNAEKTINHYEKIAEMSEIVLKITKKNHVADNGHYYSNNEYWIFYPISIIIMNEGNQIQIHERITRLEVKYENTLDIITTLSKVVETQGQRITKAIIVGIVLLVVGILSNGGTDSVIKTLQNMAKFFT